MPKKAPSEWNLHVKDIFKKNRSAKGKSYSFKQALKDAAASWSGKGTSGKKANKMKGGQIMATPSKVRMQGGQVTDSDEDDDNSPLSTSSSSSDSTSTPTLGGGKKSRKRSRKSRKSMKGRKKTRKSRK